MAASHSELENSIREKLMMNSVSVVPTVFQFSYTAVFGAYTAFIFIRTGDPFIYILHLEQHSVLVCLGLKGFFFGHFWSANSFFMPLPPTVIWFTVGGNDLFYIIILLSAGKCNDICTKHVFLRLEKRFVDWDISAAWQYFIMMLFVTQLLAIWMLNWPLIRAARLWKKS